MIDTLVAGGPVMVPIAVCSVIALATFFERLWSVRRGKIVPRALAMELLELVRQQRWDDALAKCRSVDVPVARLIETTVEARAQGRAEIKERLQEVGRKEAAEMERYVPILGTIASITPLLGLLGTVGGMILTFQVIEEQGVGEVGALAGGISQALITTFAGLCVGIPALVANRYLLARVDSLLGELEEISLASVDLVHGEEA